MTPPTRKPVLSPEERKNAVIRAAWQLSEELSRDGLISAWHAHAVALRQALQQLHPWDVPT